MIQPSKVEITKFMENDMKKGILALSPSQPI